MDTHLYSSKVVDTTRSSFARLRPVALEDVKIEGGFWGSRRDTLANITLLTQHELLENTGRLDNLRRAQDSRIPFKGYYFNDSDVHKWLEAAAWMMASRPSERLLELVTRVKKIILQAQQPDGYLNSYFLYERAGERWTNLRDMHELYCAGHFIQAAIALGRTMADQDALSAAMRLADLICSRFGPAEQGKIPGVPGHEEIETALIELYRLTREEKYLHQARYFIEARGHGLIGGRTYHQDHIPYYQMDAMVGHAVRALYLNMGATDLFLETGILPAWETLVRLWTRLVSRQTYLTGGIGSRHSGEALGDDYELPNQTAYAETCAAIASVMWNYRMLLATGDARYADQMEITLYNGVLSGWGLDGKSYFYTNPLADPTGAHRRMPWFDCACCPPNLARLVASLPGYLYSVEPGGVWVHHYAAGCLCTSLPDQTPAAFTLESGYPWDGLVKIRWEADTHAVLHLRIPGWVGNGPVDILINGKAWEDEIKPGAYLSLPGPWKAQDIVEINFPMVGRLIESHPAVVENRGHAALARGPLIYCFEGCDQPGLAFEQVFIRRNAGIRVKPGTGILEGMALLELDGFVQTPGLPWKDELYRPLPEKLAKPANDPVQLTAIPYFAWANREPGSMVVWLRKEG